MTDRSKRVALLTGGLSSLGRHRPRRWLRPALFLVSPGSDMISGQNIGIDGGW